MGNGWYEQSKMVSPGFTTGNDKYSARDRSSSCAPDFQTSSPMMATGFFASISALAAFSTAKGSGSNARPLHETIRCED